MACVVGLVSEVSQKEMAWIWPWQEEEGSPWIKAWESAGLICKS
jgi:hypothetical protein